MKPYFTIIIIVLSILVFSCDNGDGGDGKTTITLANIEGVEHPATGEIPTSTITPTAQYTGSVTWAITNPPEGTSSSVSGLFQPNTSYTATITLTPTTLYTVQGVAANYFTVVGSSQIITTNSADSNIVRAQFPPTGSRQPFNVSIIQGINIPATGATVVRDFTTPQFKGNVQWVPPITGTSPAFQPDVEYTAIITLEPSPTHTWHNVPANFFTIEGARTVTNPAGTTFTTTSPASVASPNLGISGEVHAIFYPILQPVTVNTIGGANEPLVPKTGDSPVKEIIGRTSGTPVVTQYKGKVIWFPEVAEGDEFEASTVYRAEIELTAEPVLPSPPGIGHFSFAGLSSSFFTVTGATTTTFTPYDARTGLLIAIFPATAAATTQ